jgi:hypothetical protein
MSALTPITDMRRRVRHIRSVPEPASTCRLVGRHQIGSQANKRVSQANESNALSSFFNSGTFNSSIAPSSTSEPAAPEMIVVSSPVGRMTAMASNRPSALLIAIAARSRRRQWEAAGFLGMSVEMLDRVYGHHHPDHLKTAARAIGYRPRQSLVYSLANERERRRDIAQRVENIGGPGRTRTCNQAVMSEARSPEDQAKSDDSDVT